MGTNRRGYTQQAWIDPLTAIMIRAVLLAILYGASLAQASYEVALEGFPDFCKRKNFYVSAVQKQSVVAKNTTMITPTLVSTTCKESISFCIGPYMVENTTEIEKTFNNTFLYEWTPSNSVVETLDCGCPKCELEATDALNGIPLAGCDLYTITKIGSVIGVPVIKSDVVYTYL